MKKGAGLLDHKPKRQTAKRIADAALLLFNRYGEPSVTASAIAADIGISHGNLHYHYPSKEKIVEDLFKEFQHEIGHTLAAPEGRPVHAEDFWLFLHLTFEIIFKYRFIYRDLNELLSRHRIIETQFKDILIRQRCTASALLCGLASAGSLSAETLDCDALAESMIMIATYWLSYQYVLNPRTQPDNATLTHGIVRALSLANPYLAPGARALFEHLSRQYLNTAGDGHGSQAAEMEKLSG
ncbi:MAG: TetR/AcrR family transcriptional regulator [Rhodomicrobium sp.]